RVRDEMERGCRARDGMERDLADRRFCVAERYAIADIALYADTHAAHEGDFHLGRYRNVRAWLTRVASQAGHVPRLARHAREPGADVPVAAEVEVALVGGVGVGVERDVGDRVTLRDAEAPVGEVALHPVARPAAALHLVAHT